MSLAVLAPARHVLGAPVRAMTMEAVLELIDDVIAMRGRLRIGVVNAAKLVNMRRDDLLRRDVLSSDVILADGMSVVWASRLLGRPVPERVAGIDLMLALFSQGGARGYRVFFLGATEDVLRRVTQRVAAEYPGVVVAGQRNGYFSPAEEPAVAAEIGAARPDVLLIAMTSPRKEHFMARWGAELDVPVWHGVGGSFDVMAGKVQRAPERWQRLGLEWLYRVRQEPRRLWRRYLVTNTLFCGLVGAELARHLLRPAPPGAQRGYGEHI
jgi:N-acetylglucosaminyldiphosphoundecaprenol N-acetyl-beta-D-mannosaminyltransferase